VGTQIFNPLIFVAEPPYHPDPFLMNKLSKLFILYQPVDLQVVSFLEAKLL